MNKKFLFSNNKISYDDYLKVISSMVNHSSSICSRDCLETGISSITKIDDPDKRQKMIDISVDIDREFTESSPNIYRKLPLIMCLANMIENHYDFVKNLTNEDLVLLSAFSFVVKSNEMQGHLELFGDHALLKEVIKKVSYREEQMRILGIIEDKYFELGIDKADSEELTKFKKESLMFIKCSSREELLGAVIPVEELFEEALERKTSF